MKRIVIALSCLSLLCGIRLNAQTSEPWTGNVATEFAGGSGTEDDPYLITDGSHLALLDSKITDYQHTLTGTYFRLENDIDLGGALESPTQWNPIGKNLISFDGFFDGNGKKIYNIYCEQPSNSNLGFFSKVGSNGTVKDLTIASGSFNGAGNVGGIAGNSDGRIENCRNYASVKGWKSGGYFAPTGGIVGNNMGTISGCVNFGTVTGSLDLGGLAGTLGKNSMTTGVLENSINFGTIELIEGATGAYLGGLVGRNATGDATINRCINLGTINFGEYTGNTQYAAALVGSLQSKTILKECLAAANVLLLNGNISGICNGTAQIESCYNDMQISSQSNQSVSTGTLTTATGPEGFDPDAWVFQEGAYPMLKIFAEEPEINIGALVPLLYYNNESEYDKFNAIKHDFELPAIEEASWKIVKGTTAVIEGNTVKVTRLLDKSDTLLLEASLNGHSRQFQLVVLMQAVPLKITQAENGILKVYAGETEITDGTSVEENTLLRIEAIPNEGYLLDYLTINGERIEEPSFNIKGQTEISAVFMADVDPEPWDGTIASSFGAGLGSRTAPYQIRTPQELAFLAQEVNSGNTYPQTYFLLVHNLDLNLQEWNPIGLYGSSDANSYAFAGNFEGNGKTIKKMSITDAASVYAGLFGNVDGGATICNLHVDSSYIDIASTEASNSSAGLIAGQSAATISNCSASGRVEGSFHTAGGLVGYVRLTMQNCTGNVDVVNMSGYAGGIAGSGMVSDIINCHTYADSIVGKNAGGIIANSNSGEIRSCTNAAIVKAEAMAGGIVAQLSGSTFGSSMERCANSGTVIGEDAGGIAGLPVSSINDCFNAGMVQGSMNAGGIAAMSNSDGNKISSCYNIGEINVSSAYGTKGELIATFQYGNVTNSYFDKQMKPHATAFGTRTGNASFALLTTQFVDSLPDNFDTAAWQHESGRYPLIKGLPLSRGMDLQTAALKLHVSNDSLYDTPGRIRRDMGIFTASGVEWKVEKSKTLSINDNIIEVNALDMVDTSIVSASLGQYKKEYTLLINPMRYLLAIAQSEGGSILAQTPQGEAIPNGSELAPNDSVWLNQESQTGWYFEHWFDGDTASRKLLIMDEDKTVSATFARFSYTITASRNEGGSITPEGESEVLHGESLTFTILPEDGYRTDSLIVDGEAVTVQNSYTFSHVEANHSIRAVFAPITFTITATAGAHGCISPEGETIVEYGTSQSYTITPDEGYVVSSLTIDGVSMEAATNYTFNTIIADHSIHAEFKEDVANKQSPASLFSVVMQNRTIVIRNNTESGLNIRIFDVQGNTLCTRHAGAGTTLRIPANQTGIYLIQAWNASQSASTKILVL